MTPLPSLVIELLKRIQKEFLWKRKIPKIKNTTLCNDFENGGLKNVDIISKIISLQCSWIKRLFDKNFHQWKIIPLHLIRKYLGKNFKFHSNLALPDHILVKFPKFYQEIFTRWGKSLSSNAIIPSTIANQFIWFNNLLKIDHKVIFLQQFSDNNLNFVGQLFNSDGSLKSWDFLKTEFFLTEKLKFQWMQLIHALPKPWREGLKLIEGNEINNLFIQDHHLIKRNNVYILEKLNSRELYNMQMALKYTKQVSQSYYENKFPQLEYDWRKIYTLPRIATCDSNLRVFQYKLLNNILYLNKALFRFGFANTSLCSFCNIYDETPFHLFFFL